MFLNPVMKGGDAMATQSQSVKVKKGSVAKEAPVPAGRTGYHPLFNLRDEVDRVFDNFFHGWPSVSPYFRRLADLDPMKDLGNTPFRLSPIKMSPDMDASETEDAYEITVELPGMEEKDIELTLSDGMLTLKGEKKEEREDTKKDYHLTERSYGEFRRTFPVPDAVDVKNVGAEFRKGVLTVTLPKTKQAKARTRKIEVKAK